MNDAPRYKLREIVRQHGRSIIENPRRLENLLRDYCGEFRREISVLTMALDEQAVADMLAAPASALPRKVTLARLAQRLRDNLALSEAAARWSIESWAWALGLITDAELDADKNEQTGNQSEIKTAKNASSASIVAPTTQTKQNSPSNQTAQTKPATLPQSANVRAQSSTFVVAPSGGNYTSISEALRNVPANSRLLIREGLYHESVALDKNVEIVGDGALEKIIVRSQNQSCVSMQTDRATVRGLTLQGRGKSSSKSFFAVDVSRGELTLENCVITSDSLSCVAIHGASANPLIKHCRIHDGADSGIYIFDNARASIEKCDVFRNRNVNLAITQGANPTIKNCRIFEGNNGGIVVWGNGAAGEIENCEIYNHRLANIGIRDSANPTFRNCKIFGGRDTGAFVSQGGYGKFEDCFIYDNQKAEVVIVEKSNSVLRRCAIYNGTTSGVFVDGEARTLIENCNIYDNADAGISVSGASIIAVHRCNIHRNATVAVRVKGKSAASVENCDLRGNRIAAWETEHGVVVERKNNRED